MRTEEQVRRGLAEVEARRAAVERFGDVDAIQATLGSIDRERVRSESRRAALADGWQDVAYAVRIIARKPLSAIIIVLCLALGIGAATTVVSVGDALLLRPLPYPNGSQLVHVGTLRGATRRINVASFVDFTDWRIHQRTFDAFGALQRQSYALVEGDAIRTASGASATSGVFASLGVRPAHGRLFLPTDDDPRSPEVAIVSATLAGRMFGSVERAVGSRLTLGQQRLEVVGVLDAAAMYPDGVELMTSMPRAPVPEDRDTRSLELIGALREGVTVDAARRDLAAISTRIAREVPGVDSTITAGVQPLRNRYVGTARPAFAAVAAAAALLLVIACANVASLQLARGWARVREIAVRTALGATRERVLRLLLTESLILAVTGGLAGIAVALLSSRVVALSIPTSFAAWMTPTVDLRVLGATLVISGITGVGFGLLPALRLSRLAPARTLHGGARSGMDRTRLALQRGFVAVQMALSVVLLVGATMAATRFTSFDRDRAAPHAMHSISLGSTNTPQTSQRRDSICFIL
jgi:predicted permease